MTEPRTGMAGIWSDGLGRASIRSVQVLMVAALGWAIIWAVTRIPFVIIPVLIAVILAAAIAPLVRWLTGRSWPRALAVVASFVAILAVVGGVLAGIVVLVSRQWAELSARAVAGVDQLHSFLNTGPVPVSDQQITAAVASVR